MMWERPVLVTRDAHWAKSTKAEYRDGNYNPILLPSYSVEAMPLLHLPYILKMDPHTYCTTIRFEIKLLNDVYWQEEELVSRVVMSLKVLPRYTKCGNIALNRPDILLIIGLHNCLWFIFHIQNNRLVSIIFGWPRYIVLLSSWIILLDIKIVNNLTEILFFVFKSGTACWP